MRTRPDTQALTGATWRAGVEAMTGWLAGFDEGSATDRERIEAIEALRGLVAAAGAAQLRWTAAYAASQRSQGVGARGIAASVGFAQRVGIAQAQRLVSASTVITTDLPHTLDLVTQGELSLKRAVVVAERVADLDPATRAAVDEQVGTDLARLGDAQVRDAVDTAVMGLDPDHVQARHQAAQSRRRISVRPVGDGMAWLSILTSLVEAAAAEKALRRHADQALADQAVDEDGEGMPSRSLGAAMADTAVERLTGRAIADGPPVEVHLLMTPDTLTGTGPGADTPAYVLGAGPIPARTARDLLRPRTPPTAATRPISADPMGLPVGEVLPDPRPVALFEGPDWEFDDDVLARAKREAALVREQVRRETREAKRVTIRGVHLDPSGRAVVGIDARRWVLPAPFRERLGDPDQDHDGAVTTWLGMLRSPPRPRELVPLESSERLYTGMLRRFIEIRDHRCRAPWCGAPLRHVDHAHPWRCGGTTCAHNGHGLCVGHNLAKENPGFTVTPAQQTNPAQPHTVTWTTPTGHNYTSTAPPPGWSRQVPDLSPLERRLTELLAS